MPSPRNNTVTVDEARRDILSHVAPITRTENLPVARSLGRVIRETVKSPVDIPAYTNSAMDGYAFDSSVLPAEADATVRLGLAGESLAGHPFTGAVPLRSAVRITTGAVMPASCDTVIPFEKTQSDSFTVAFTTGDAKAGANVRRQGETLKAGDVAIAAGTRLTAAHAALLANLGIASVKVTAPVRAGIIATGDELVNPGQVCPADHIYNANSTALAVLLTGLGAEAIDYGIVPDAADAVNVAFSRAARECDIIFTSGGAAAGEADFTHKVLQERGTILPWNVNMRPGKPMRFGTLAGKPVFLLPGNPVAAFVTFLEFARGAVLAMAGVPAESSAPREFPVRLAKDVKKKDGRAEFMRAVLTVTEAGEVAAMPLKDQGSAALTNLTGSDVILALPTKGAFIPAGSLVTAQLLSELAR